MAESTATVGAAAVPEEKQEEAPKHHLQNSWKFWYFENTKDKSWEESLRVVSPFQTVEDFWSIYNHIKSASEIRVGASYFVFKDGIKPMWEDTLNRNGGRWLVTFNKQGRQHLDSYWLEVLLCLIGEAFDDDGDDICGAVVDIRPKQDRISIWTGNANNKERIFAIGRKIRDRLSLQGVTQMNYEVHAATANKSGSFTKPLHVL